MSKQITIRMPKADLAAALAALRDPNSKQATGSLYDPQTQGFCCLGLMQFIKTGGKIESYSEVMPGYDLREPSEIDGVDIRALGLPTVEWLKSAGWTFIGMYGYLDAESPFLPSLRCTASTANDVRKNTFAEIADAIEACAEGY